MKRIWEGDDALNIHDVFVVDGKGKRIDDE